MLNAPNDLSRVLDRVRANLGVSLAFGGFVSPQGSLTLQEFSGPTRGMLKGLTLGDNEGLGGRTLSLRRPVAVSNYFLSGQITHRYDSLIYSEGLRSMVAAPVVVDRRPVALIYAALRTDGQMGGRVVDCVMDEARSFEQDIAISRAEKTRDADDGDVARLKDQVRSAYSELRGLSSVISDSALRERLREIATRLAGTESESPTVTLTARELDVMSLIAMGKSNDAIATRLGLTLYTVKSYVRTVMVKLNSSTRLEAVVQARGLGLLP